MRYRTKQVEVEAVRWDGVSFDSRGKPLPTWLMHAHGQNKIVHLENKTLRIATPEGDMIAYPGDYIIQGARGEVYPCKHELFGDKYELISDEGPASAGDVANPS